LRLLFFAPLRETSFIAVLYEVDFSDGFG
jgi:hypothetical protein